MHTGLNKVLTNEKSMAAEIGGNVFTIGEVLNSLSRAVSTLQSMKDFETNAFFKNFEMRFPKDGIDFYKAIKLYEINLIKQALRATRGHQAKAAKLLKMRTSTLNSIIKRYDIRY